MKNYSEKELMVFQGVLKLIEQGVDLHTVKVQEIASAAGIGKGTLYEYFSSKDDIIRQTLSYWFQHEIDFFEGIIAEHSHFDEAMEYILTHLEQVTFPTARLCLSLFCAFKIEPLDKTLAEECRTRFINATNALIMLGRKDGIIADSCTDEYCLFVLRAAALNLAPEQMHPELHDRLRTYYTKLFHNAFRA